MRFAKTARIVGLTALTALLLAGPSALAGPKLNIDYVNGEEFAKEGGGQIVFYFDLLDDEYNVIGGLQAGDVTVAINGESVEGEIVIETLAQAKQWIGVAILMAAHRSYGAFEADTDDEGEEVEKPPETFALQKQGFASMLRKLEGGSDRVAVYMYNEKGMKPVVGWTENHSRAAEQVEGTEFPMQDDVKDIKSPPLYSSIKAVVDAVREAADDLPRRKLVIVMSDGKDKKAVKRKAAETQIKGITELANDNEIKVLAIGYTSDDPEPLVYMEQLAAATKGVYRPIKTEDQTSIPDILEQLGTELKKQYVLTFTPNEEYKGSEEPVSMRVELITPEDDGKRKAVSEVEGIKIGEKATDIWKILTPILIGLGALLGLIILFLIIRAIIRSRRNRPVEYYEEEEEHVGPYKGKLAVMEGELVGAEYYLTEDVTTIGSIDGNGIVLPTSGVSKRHAGIKIEDMRFELADFGSTNGTFVNGSKITKQFLRDGDLVGIGDCKMKFTLK